MFNLGPPLRAGGDPFWSNVVLLVTADGALGTTPTDASSYAEPAAGGSNDVVITDAQGLFNGKSFWASVGNNDYLSFASGSGQLTMGTEDFTLEYWFQCESGFFSGYHFLFYAVAPSSNDNSIQVSTSTTLGYAVSFPSSGLSGSVAVPSLGTTWHHFAYVRSGTSVRHYLDGSLLATRTVGAGGWSSTNGIRIAGNASFRFRGYMDQFRVTRGVQRYTGSSYIVPTEPFPQG